MMEEEDFSRTLRLNLLEMMNYSRTIKNIKRYSDADMMVQLESLYRFSHKKPSHEDLVGALIFLLKRNLLDVSQMGSIDMYSISERGRETLARVADGDDTVIY